VSGPSVSSMSVCVRLLAAALQRVDGLCCLLGSNCSVTDTRRVQVIKKHKNSHQKYIDRLIAEGTLTEDEVSVVHNRIQRTLQEEFDLAKDYKPKEDDWLSSVWVGFKTPAQRSRIRNTGLPCTAQLPLSLRSWPRPLRFDCISRQHPG
jgi:2-oxoglutarate dehydrogenase complex dehydrogenase (E1) component-like enzyme